MPAWMQAVLSVTSDRVEMKGAAAESFVSARTSRAEQPEAMAGVHSDYVLLVADEASGIPEQVFEAAAGSMSGEHCKTLLLGNPVRGSGFFYDTHHRLKGAWKCFHLSCLDSPRVSREFIENEKLFGEDSNRYRVRVLGEFPKADDDTVIPLELVEGAQHRDTSDDVTSEEVWGLDVARFGDDATVLTKRRGRVVPLQRAWYKLDTMQTVGVVKAEYDAAEPKPKEILVDSIGVGAGVVDRLHELGLPVRGINVSESPAMGDRYRNLRAELWFKGKAWLERRDCKLPRDEMLFSELVSPRYSVTSSGKIQIEGKAEMKKRGLKSPDKADSLMITFASEAFVAQTGYSERWDKPIKRNLAVA